MRTQSFFFILPFLFNFVIWSPCALQSTYHQINVPIQEENVYLKFLMVVDEQMQYQGVQWSEFHRNFMPWNLDVVVFQLWNPDVVGRRVSAEF